MVWWNGQPGQTAKGPYEKGLQPGDYPSPGTYTEHATNRLDPLWIGRFFIDW